MPPPGKPREPPGNTGPLPGRKERRAVAQPSSSRYPTPISPQRSSLPPSPLAPYVYVYIFLVPRPPFSSLPWRRRVEGGNPWKRTSFYDLCPVIGIPTKREHPHMPLLLLTAAYAKPISLLTTVFLLAEESRRKERIIAMARNTLIRPPASPRVYLAIPNGQCLPRGQVTNRAAEPRPQKFCPPSPGSPKSAVHRLLPSALPARQHPVAPSLQRRGSAHPPARACLTRG